MTLTFNPRQARMLSNVGAKTNIRKSVDSKDSVETNGRTAGRMLPIALPSRLITRSYILNIQYMYTVSQKNCTPKAGRHKFIKISSPIIIFRTRHCHSVAERLSSKSLVRVEYQLQGFHGNQAPNNRMLFITECIRRRRCLIYCL